MTNLDQFESVFKSSDKPPFVHEQVKVDSVLVITGLDHQHSQAFDSTIHEYLTTLSPSLRWKLLTGDQFDEVEQLLQLIERFSPNLICTYRNLRTPAHGFAHSLGVFVEVITQVTATPILLVPTPDEMKKQPELLDRRRTVMAITDHLAGDHHLVSYAAYLTDPDGTLFLSHVEDQAVFDRYLQVISKTPEIDTDTAREGIQRQLLKEPHDYIRSCREALAHSDQHLDVEEIMTLGHRLNDYKRLIEQHAVDLLVMNTKDQDQMAMHGLAYPLAVELREIPLLLL